MFVHREEAVGFLLDSLMFLDCLSLSPWHDDDVALARAMWRYDAMRCDAMRCDAMEHQLDYPCAAFVCRKLGCRFLFTTAQ